MGIRDSFLRENTPWCSSIPEDIFFNHVLYYRINTEDIVDCRRTFYDLCWPRLVQSGKTGSMKEAALELNYWCFENATYRTTDDRTANPMTVLRCAYGRCGEESTFATTAFRSVGIPTRQIYTPRWPHCDDNHAWIEVWCDGDWHYLGACEPEEVLDKGWFTAAASRAMIIHSRMFSDYVENEEIVTHEGLTTVCNELSRYADTQTFSVTVTENGQPLSGVTLRIELLNYSEFFPISTLVTDENGKASITLGLGDLHIHALKDRRFITRLVDTRKEPSVQIDFTNASACQTTELDGAEYDVVPPKDNMKFAVRLTDEQKATQQQRFDHAASLLHRKEGTFHTEQSAAQAAQDVYKRQPEWLCSGWQIPAYTGKNAGYILPTERKGRGRWYEYTLSNSNTSIRCLSKADRKDSLIPLLYHLSNPLSIDFRKIGFYSREECFFCIGQESCCNSKTPIIIRHRHKNGVAGSATGMGWVCAAKTETLSPRDLSRTKVRTPETSACSNRESRMGRMRIWVPLRLSLIHISRMSSWSWAKPLASPCRRR